MGKEQNNCQPKSAQERKKKKSMAGGPKIINQNTVKKASLAKAVKPASSQKI